VRVIKDRSQPAWFAIYVKPRHEKKVFSVLTGKGFQGFLPLYKSDTRTKISENPLFPGYVFCRFIRDDRLPILSTPGVFSIVAFGNDPAPIEDSEVDSLRSVLASGLIVRPRPYLSIGQKVRILDGPLRGVEGIVKDCHAEELVVSITLLQRSVEVKLKPHWITY